MYYFPERTALRPDDIGPGRCPYCKINYLPVARVFGEVGRVRFSGESDPEGNRQVEGVVIFYLNHS